jgi:hypothetical protein
VQHVFSADHAIPDATTGIYAERARPLLRRVLDFAQVFQS